MQEDTKECCHGIVAMCQAIPDGERGRTLMRLSVLKCVLFGEKERERERESTMHVEVREQLARGV